MIAYRKHPDGRATDLRFVRNDYQPVAGETLVQGDTLPDIATLHEQKFRDQKAKQEAARLIEQENGGWTRRQREWLHDNCGDAKLRAALVAIEGRIVTTGVRG